MSDSTFGLKIGLEGEREFKRLFIIEGVGVVCGVRRVVAG